ncbi:MAG: type IV toxin-antitoxin system AbiEi family antitoxin [Rhodospirillaceae bacterium]|nr:type IV toxin-antitoxin system AbiEi family antitoxin [Rhodospirillaceae bacterium]
MERQHQSVRHYLDSLAAAGQYHFASTQIQESLGVSAAAAKLALNRLAKQGLIAAPARGFYVIVPPEYRALGCLPADQFIPALMERLGLPYYAGLLSAAQYYGAAHHRPQEFQVIVAKNRRPVACGAVRVQFVARKRTEEVATRAFNTPRGTIQVSTPEATAIDLAGYPGHVGGLDQVATVLEELAEQIDPDALEKAALTAPLPWAQRLGYLLDLVDAGDRAGPLRAHVEHHVRDYAPFIPGAAKDSNRRASAWKLILNADVEPEL